MYMGNSIKIKKVSFEDVQNFIAKRPPNIYLINVMLDAEQGCLIPHTVVAAEETALINRILENGVLKQQTRFIIYGKNANDEKLQEQYMKLYNLGFPEARIFVYLGGMFEWLLLQEVYSREEFPTTTYELDILKYKGPSAEGALRAQGYAPR